MATRNPHISKFHSSYLFPEIVRRRDRFLERNPDVKLLSLGVGDTTQPLPKLAINEVVQFADGLGTQEGYIGYGPDQGSKDLREQIAIQLYENLINSDEIYISDGAKCAIGRLQHLFGPEATVALQDPAYPAYVDISVLMGRTGQYDTTSQSYDKIVYMPCTAGNDFFPDLDNTPRTDIIYFCSPNNPTGTVATKEQLKQLVDFARANRSIIIYDAAYAPFIQDEDLPRSIYEIEGARDVAIEVHSFSKLAGFTGVRLGWTIIPSELTFDDGSSVTKDWKRLSSCLFNGASNLAEAAAFGLFKVKGLPEVKNLIAYYMENAKILKSTMTTCGLKCFGGDHAPYLWVHFPEMHSWDVFEHLMSQAHVITTPGVGFGPAGEGFVRLSALGERATTQEAAHRLSRVCPSLRL